MGDTQGWGPVPISGEGRFWRLTANLRLFEAEGRLLALAWDCSHVAPSVYVPVSWLAGATAASLSGFSGWAFLPSSKAVSPPRPSPD